MGEVYWLDSFLSNYNIVKLIAIFFILGQLVALRNRDPKLSLHYQYASGVSIILMYLLNYTLFLLSGSVMLFSTLLLELILTLGVFIFPIVKYMDRQKKEVQHE